MKWLETLATRYQDNIALEFEQENLTYQALSTRVKRLADWLTCQSVTSVALIAPNSIDWIIVDLACQAAGVICTPIPMFFTQIQISSVIDSVKAEIVFADTQPADSIELDCEDISLNVYQRQQVAPLSAPDGTQKITYTSGSTGAPKGVCLSTDNQMAVASSLVTTIGIDKPKHLSLLPLPVLLENVAGVYSPLMAGGKIVLTRDESRGFRGSMLAEPQALLQCISETQPNTMILVPELLQVLVVGAARGWIPPSSLRFIAVGGSKVSPTLMEKARALGLPVYQGYGLSECASVVSLSTEADDVDSVGRVLPHLTVDIINQELVVRGNTFLGYLEQPDSWYQDVVYTGDIASFKGPSLCIDGRLKNTIINSFGRNISPEWVEAELLATGLFLQVVVIGDARPFCSAIVVPARNDISEAHARQIINMVNHCLPDYARVQNPIVLSTPMTPEQGLYTNNMRPRRAQIEQHFQQQIERVYNTAQLKESA
ncbi:AMP-binding protein [Alteromonas facilis]|uniref:AMP-binding protein n=1 Tax=Alteromonas facilis TaxID=2048004 RepID=UPI000C28805F|nr:AMP-binding protein [Alteromonas facilis]